MDDSDPDGPLSPEDYGHSVDAVEYDPEADVYRVSADLSQTEPFAYLVVDAVATITGRDLVSLAPLQDTVDADAMDELLRSAPHTQVRFRYEGCEVTVFGDGEIVISVLDSRRTAGPNR